MSEDSAGKSGPQKGPDAEIKNPRQVRFRAVQGISAAQMWNSIFFLGITKLTLLKKQDQMWIIFETIPKIV